MLHRHPVVPTTAVYGLRLRGEDEARQFFEACFADANPAIETLFVAHVDGGSRCIHLSRHEGDAAGTAMPLRTILLDAAAHGTVGVLVAHNHPSGDATPSVTDRQATRRLADASEAIDVTLLDHLIFGGGNCTSFRRIGLL